MKEFRLDRLGGGTFEDAAAPFDPSARRSNLIVRVIPDRRALPATRLVFRNPVLRRRRRHPRTGAEEPAGTDLRFE